MPNNVLPFSLGQARRRDKSGTDQPRRAKPSHKGANSLPDCIGSVCFKGVCNSNMFSLLEAHGRAVNVTFSRLDRSAVLRRKGRG
jgi:hypothetical protein